MDQLFSNYDVNATTWFWLSLILIAAVFFRFDRLWSARNLDLLLLVGLSPGLLFTQAGSPTAGYAWLFTASGLLLLRVCLDGFFQRRPRLEQNLNRHGMLFLLVAMSTVLVTKIATEPPAESTVDAVRSGDHLIKGEDAEEARKGTDTGPAPSLLAALLVTLSGGIEVVAARVMAILAHIAVVAGLWFVGRRHFGDNQIGLAMATLYLLLPCTALDVQKVNHVLPAALTVWAIAAYRNPLVSGSLLGLACGTVFFPVFLLPLWLVFYGRLGALRFGLALGVIGAVLLLSLLLTSADTYSFTRQIIGSIDWSVLKFRDETVGGFWTTHSPAYRIPVFAAYVVMLIFVTIWPREKNLEHLLAYSTALVLGTQFWYPQQGGVYLLWYVPLFLMVAFRPRLGHLTSPNSVTTGRREQSEKDTSRATLFHTPSRTFTS